MNTVQFKGHHSLLAQADASALPDGGSHRLWQAWLMPSGNYMVQALTQDKIPEGDVHLIGADVFHSALTPLLASVNSQTHASAANLLHEWYNETASLKGQELYGAPVTDYGKQDMPPLHPLTLAAASAVSNLPACPGIFPEKSPTEQTASEGSAQNPVQQLTADQISEPRASTDAACPARQSAVEQDRLDSQSCRNAPEKTNRPDKYCASPYHNPAMPKQIADILAQLHTEDRHLVQERLNQVIDIPSIRSLPAYQSVMTELGLVLRREKLYDAAKQCHLRALEITPDDERILFNVARTEYEAGNIAAAQEYLRHCLEVAPEFNVARNFLAFISTGT